MNPRAIAIQCAQLASERAAAEVHQDMAGGLNVLATIAATAPMLGVLGCVFGIIGSFGGHSGEKSAMFAALTWSLSEAILRIAPGLGLGILAFVSYQILRNALEALDSEMKAATLAMMNQL